MSTQCATLATTQSNITQLLRQHNHPVISHQTNACFLFTTQHTTHLGVNLARSCSQRYVSVLLYFDERCVSSLADNGFQGLSGRRDMSATKYGVVAHMLAGAYLCVGRDVKGSSTYWHARLRRGPSLPTYGLDFASQVLATVSGSRCCMFHHCRYVVANVVLRMGMFATRGAAPFHAMLPVSCVWDAKGQICTRGFEIKDESCPQGVVFESPHLIH